MTSKFVSLALVLSLWGCSDEPANPQPELEFTVVTFNTGTTTGLAHDDLPDDGYTSAEAALSDRWYGNGLAWSAVIESARVFFAGLQPDIVVFQEIFHPGNCASIPDAATAGFVCDNWTDGDPSVAQQVMGLGYQVVCNLGKPDKCAAVKRSFGTFRGCSGDLCLDGLEGSAVAGCGSGARIGRGVIDLAVGGSITLVNIHGSSGLSAEDKQCRVAQFEQVFVDLGDGAPGASGALNVVMGDLNTDPSRFASTDPSALRFMDFVGLSGADDGKAFHFVSEVGDAATPSYQGVVNIDHVASDAYTGDCWGAGITAGHRAVTDTVYFDHVPLVCDLAGPLPPL